MFSLIYKIWTNEAPLQRNRFGGPLTKYEGAIGSRCSSEASEGSLQHWVFTAVHKLPDDQRVAMLLVAVERFSYVEAAKIMGVSLSQIMTCLSMARQDLGRECSGRGS